LAVLIPLRVLLNFRIAYSPHLGDIKGLSCSRWHKGDALVIVHYVGLARPSEVKIENIDIWVQFYDLPLQ
jgi:hypothetical protein